MWKAFHGTRSGPFKQFDLSRAESPRGVGIFLSATPIKALDFARGRDGLVAEVTLTEDPNKWPRGDECRRTLPERLKARMDQNALAFQGFGNQQLRDWLVEQFWQDRSTNDLRRRALLSLGVAGLRCEDDVGHVKQEFHLLTDQVIQSIRWLKKKEEGYLTHLHCLQTGELVYSYQAMMETVWF